METARVPPDPRAPIPDTRGPGLDRRAFLSAALIGLTTKSGRTIAGGFVNESHVAGHWLRDGRGFPTPRETQRVPVVVVGCGIAGLSAGWQLHRQGFRDFVILEMEDKAGGNARWGENEVSAFPWGAHYVPVPGAAAGLVRELFTELGVYDGQAWDDLHLVHAPDERLFIHGRWQEGLEPQVGPTRRDRDQFARFADRIAELRASRRFTIPMAVGTDLRQPPAEDAISMAAWLDREGFDSPYLRWLVDYATRDDYGARAGDVSAWAALLYYAARDDDDIGPLTWPEGNGWIVQRLLERLAAHVRTRHLTYRVERTGRGWRVLTAQASPDGTATTTAWVAQSVIVAAPTHVATRIVQDAPVVKVTSSPWLVANLTLDRWPRERGFPVAWDNVIFDSPSLGYVVATHQSLRRHVPRTVWTYYRALSDQPPTVARQWLLAQDWASLRDLVIDDLSRAHQDLRDCVTRVDIMRHGHAMVRPTPGLLSDPAWQSLRVGHDRLYYAHSDVSGLPLFEEAQYRGVTAANAALGALRGSG